VTANPSQVLRNPLYHSLRFATQMFRFWVNSHLSKQKRIKPHKKYTKKTIKPQKKSKIPTKKLQKIQNQKIQKILGHDLPFSTFSPPVSLLTQSFLSFSYLLYLLNWIHQSNPLFQTSITILFNIKTNKTSNMKEDHTTINTSTPTKNKNKSKKNNKTKTYYFMSFFFSFLSFSPLDCFYFFVVCFILCCFLFPFQQQSFFLFFPLSFFLL